MNYSVKTDRGKRKDNQDYTATFFNQSNVLLAILCDGLGGHQAGDIASEMAVSQIGNSWEQTIFTSEDTYLIQTWLKEVINRENTRIFEAANAYPDLAGMGTTLVAGVILEKIVLFANIGDSRAYTYQDNGLTLVTEDHSFVSELQRRGELTDLEAKNHVNRNALTRSLGVEGDLDIDFFKVLKDSIDLVLLNSDGLSNALVEEQMVDILNSDHDLDQKAEDLVNLAIINDASDNVTVNLINVQSDSLDGAGE